MWVAWPAIASSIELSTTSQIEVVQAAHVGRADVHARPAADRLEALQDLDALGACMPIGRCPWPARPSLSAAGWSVPGAATRVIGPPPVSRSYSRARSSCVVVLDRDPSTLARAAERHLGRQRLAQAALQLLHVGRGRALAPAFSRRSRPSRIWRTQLLRLANRQAARLTTTSSSCLLIGRSSRPAIARAWPSLIWPSRSAILDVCVDVEQAQRVGDGRARLADAGAPPAPASGRTRPSAGGMRVPPRAR